MPPISSKIKAKKTATATAAQRPTIEDLPIKGSRLEDWIDKTDLMKKFNLSANTVDNYIRQGILRYTPFGGRKYFYLPHILHGFEQRYR